MARRKPPKKRRREFVNRPLTAIEGLERHPAPSTPAKPLQPPPLVRVAATPGQDEGQLFSSAMDGVEPLANRKENLPPPPKVPLTVPLPDREAEEVMQALRDLVEGEEPLSIYETDEAIEGAVEGLDAGILKRLRAGEFSVQDHLDLHGFTWRDARAQVERFLADSVLQGKRCILIIHGRGHGSKDHQPVLKTALKNWFLRGGIRKQVLAFTTAQPCDGGAGAIYVLLRKRRLRCM